MAPCAPGFEVVWEIEPPARPELAPLDAQVDAAAGVATSILVPDNHTGRATVSSIVVARHVRERGVAVAACLNARDRNLLGLRRDLLTCTFEGIGDVLLVYGDAPEIGARASGLTVRTMLEECRLQAPHLRVGVTTRLRALPSWKATADRLFVQVSYDLDALLRWRDQLVFDGPVLPAVMVVPTTTMARRLAARVPELRVPDAWLDAIERDPSAGVHLAVELVERIRGTGVFEGVHVVAGRRHAAAAAALRERSAPEGPLPLVKVHAHV
jgi:5,10-methylenetetrahydrofolate reductase